MRAIRPFVVVALCLLGACSGEDAADFRVVSDAVEEATLAPADSPSLIITTGEADREVATDLDGLDALGSVEAVVDEPWLQREVTFRGVWLSDVVDAFDADADAETVLLHALDDYEIRFDRDDIEVGDALLATHADGAPISVEDGGPLRLVFLRDGIGDNTDLWIWNVDRLTVS